MSKTLNGRALRLNNPALSRAPTLQLCTLPMLIALLSFSKTMLGLSVTGKGFHFQRGTELRRSFVELRSALARITGGGARLPFLSVI